VSAGPSARRQRYRRQTPTDDDDDRHQRPLLVWLLYTMCRRASSNYTRQRAVSVINGLCVIDDCRVLAKRIQRVYVIRQHRRHSVEVALRGINCHSFTAAVSHQPLRNYRE